MKHRSRHALIDALEARLCLATFTVTNTFDAGAGSLRQAIEDANRQGGADVINFAIPGPGPHTIAPLTALPAITEALTLDGTTQGGYTSAAKQIVLDGVSMDPQDAGDGLAVFASGTLIRGLAIGRFAGNGISLAGGSGSTIQDCFIGLDSAGDQARGNLLAGIFIEGSDSNTIGGTEAGQGNVISANQQSGILIVSQIEGGTSFDNTIVGNRIGTNRQGSLARGNAVAGITVTQAPNTAIGGTPDGAGNLISGNPIGIAIEGYDSSGSTIVGNRIGVQAASDNALANTSAGIALLATTQVFVSGNVVAHNLFGISVASDDGEDNANTITQNSVFANTIIGIDLNGDGFTPNDDDLLDTDTGPNSLINFPVFTSAEFDGGMLNLAGTLTAEPADSQMTLEFFFTEPAGQVMRAQGRTFIDSIEISVDENGQANWQASFELGSIPDGMVLTATTTSGDGATSEFSEPFTIEVQSLQPLQLETTDIDGTAGVPFTWDLALLVDPEGMTGSEDLDVTIEWGDDSDSPGQIVAQEGGFLIRGTHQYSEAGQYEVTLTIRHEDGRQAVESLTASIEEAVSLVPFGRRLTIEAGQPVDNQVIAFFIDPGGASDHEYQAMIDWGDGTSPTAGVVRILGSTIRVLGSHSYASSLRGWQEVTVTLLDLDEETSTEAQSRIRLTSPQRPEVPMRAVNVAAVEGASTGRVTVARFELAGASLSDLSASIDFGDGQSASGRIRQLSSTSFQVTAGHTWSAPGLYDVRTVLRVNGQRRGRVVGLARVAGAPLLASMPPLSFAAGEPFSGVVLRFLDHNPLTDPVDFAARVFWGDGTSSRTTIRETSPGQFRASASHTYAAAGSRLVRVALDDLRDGADPLVFQQRVTIQ